MNIIDKHLQIIYNETILDNIDLSKINQEHLEIIMDASYNPIYIATVWKLYKFLYEKSKYGHRLFWASCGNTVGYFKYHGHIPWDDDIDIAFEVNDDLNDYIDFLIECIKNGFIVNLQMKRESNDKLNWYENNKIVNLILDRPTIPSWSHIQETDFRCLMKNDPSKLYFANVTLKENNWVKIANNLGFKKLYRWNDNIITTPWIDVVPYFKKDDKYISHVNDIHKLIPDLSAKCDYYDFLTVPGRFPINLLEGLLQQYNENRSFNNFMHWETIYSHVKKTKIIIHYDKEQELLKFVRTYVNKYNQQLIQFINKINFDDLTN